MPLLIDVPYKQKDEAKSLGAFWDKLRKSWYIPDHKNLNDFTKWIDDQKGTIIAKKPIYIALNESDCWKCGKPIPVITLASQNYYEWAYTNEDEKDTSKKWNHQDIFTFFRAPQFINPEVAELIRNKFPFYDIGYSKTIQDHYWANHCIHCEAIQGDFFNHFKPGAPFFPTSLEECMRITLFEIPTKFDLEINADLSSRSIPDEIFECSKRKSWNSVNFDQYSKF